MTRPPPPPAPARYGERSLADLVPSVLTALGAPGFPNPLGVEPLRAACVLVVDGLGQRQVVANTDVAPRLAGAAAAAEPLEAGFPSTTAASLASLATGVPPGRHGLVGYTVPVPGHPDRPMNLLLWQLYGHGPDAPLVEEFPPERFQPVRTLLERSAAAGVRIVVAGPRDHASSPLSRAILRGGRYVGADGLAELLDVVLEALREGRSVYAYHPGLDYAGHMNGVRSDGWRGELAAVDAAVEAIVDGLPPGAGLFVTGDHGMVDLDPEQRVDVADEPALMAGVRMLAGEARARHVVARRGAERDVLAIWRDVLGDSMWVLERDEAIERGWFGPVVRREARARIGHVVAAARLPMGVFQRDVDPLQAMLTGHHGSLSDDERLVPFAAFVRDGPSQMS